MNSEFFIKHRTLIEKLIEWELDLKYHLYDECIKTQFKMLEIPENGDLIRDFNFMIRSNIFDKILRYIDTVRGEFDGQ